MEQKWYESRVMQYVIYGTLYLVINELLGFEFTVIIGIGTIIGEMQYKN